MKNVVIAVAALSLCSTVAFAGEAPAAKAPAAKAPAAKAPAAAPAPVAAAAPAPMDMSKMGPATRKPKNEKAVKKEILAWLKVEDELAKKQDMEGMLARIDFPVYMATDDQKGVPEAASYTKEKYIEMMKPFMENMPKDSTTKHKPTITVLSDSLAVMTDDFVMTAGKMKMAGKNASLLVKRDGKWMWKVMAEAGWGGMDMPAAKPEMKGEMMHDKKEMKDMKKAAAPAAPMKK